MDLVSTRTKLELDDLPGSLTEAKESGQHRDKRVEWHVPTCCCFLSRVSFPSPSVTLAKS